MPASHMMKLVSACCAGFLMSMPVTLVEGHKGFYDYRGDADRANPLGCVDPEGDKVRYLQIEIFDYNYAPGIKATWKQVSDECGQPLGDGATPFTATMEYYAGEAVPSGSQYSIDTDGQPDAGGNFPFNEDWRLQMDMYVCVPWGNYELTVVSTSTNGGNAMERIAWEIEYGPDEYHTWDTLNTPFFDTRNAGDPDAGTPGYAPIPPEGVETTYTWPLPGSEGYYSVMYSGPFPPLTGKDCPNLLPDGVAYVGCYDAGQPDWTTAAGPSGTENSNDQAEPYRMFDGLGSGDDGLQEDGVMTLEKCKSICEGYKYFGLESAIKCLCGEAIAGGETQDCGLEDDEEIPEHEYLCSGDSRVLCGTDDHVSVYSLDTGAAPPTPNPAPTPTPEPVVSGDYEKLGCAADPNPSATGSRVMASGPFSRTTMSAEICYGICAQEMPGFEFFGTQWSIECFCAAELPGGLTFDPEHDGCTDTCAGTLDGEICGGDDALTVYSVGNVVPVGPTPSPVHAVEPSGNDYTGLECFVDERDGSRAMEVRMPTNADTEMSAQICFEMCVEDDTEYGFFGLQYGYECWCSKTFAESPGGQCDYPCSQNAAEMCGGFDEIFAYQIN